MQSEEDAVPKAGSDADAPSPKVANSTSYTPDGVAPPKAISRKPSSGAALAMPSNLLVSRFSRRGSNGASQKRASNGATQKRYSSAKEDRQRKVERVERIDRWTSRRGMPLTERFANCPPTTQESTLEEHQNEDRKGKEFGPPTRGHRRTQSAPVSSALLMSLKDEQVHKDARASHRILQHCRRRFSLQSLRLRGSSSEELKEVFVTVDAN